MRELLYNSYVDFKKWTGEDSDQSNEIFAAEMSRAECRPPARVLEVGFGQGRFLDWAKAQGYFVVGVEIIDEMLERARARGHTVFEGIGEINKSESFDVIAAFDVLEHMTIEQLLEFLRFAAQILSPTGIIIARFPNGGSPFGNFYQYGDLTHATILSGVAIAQIAHTVGLETIAVNNAARPLRGGRQPWIFKRAAYLVRDLIECSMGLIYYGRREPFDPNLTVILGRRKNLENR